MKRCIVAYLKLQPFLKSVQNRPTLVREHKRQVFVWETWSRSPGLGLQNCVTDFHFLFWFQEIAQNDSGLQNWALFEIRQWKTKKKNEYRTPPKNFWEKGHWSLLTINFVPTLGAFQFFVLELNFPTMSIICKTAKILFNFVQKTIVTKQVLKAFYQLSRQSFVTHFLPVDPIELELYEDTEKKSILDFCPTFMY